MFARRRPIALAVGSAFLLPALLPVPALAEEAAVMPDVVVSATRMETAFPLNTDSADRAAVVRQLPYTSDTCLLYTSRCV